MASPPSISLVVSEPLWKHGRRSFVERLDVDTGLGQYEHTIQDFGGYWSAAMSLRGGLARIEDWLARLGWHVVTYGDGQEVCWEGFVNRVTVDAGPRTVTLGPLLDVCNRAYLVYSTVDTSTSPPTVGVRARTAVYDDTDSQGRWGIRYKVLSAGGMTATSAAYVVKRYLDERAEPKISGSLAAAGTGLGVSVELAGYVRLMDYPYNQTTTTGEMDLSDDDGTGKLQDIIDANTALDGIIEADYHYTDDNTLQVPAWENDDREALDLIKELVAMGDAAFGRYLFGIYAGRVPVYEAAPTDLAYHRRLSDPSGQITTPTGQPVFPWRVLPGRWLFYPDWFIGRTEPGSRREDNRYEFIESVVYTMPWGIKTRGGDTDTLPQILAQLGLSGIGG
jgi:hypothetical protein